jgi:hypothetical protein
MSKKTSSPISDATIDLVVSELDALNEVLVKDITRVIADIEPKNAANQKASNQITKLSLLLSQLVAQKALETKKHEVALLESSQSRVLKTNEFSSFIADLSKRIDRVTQRVEVAEKENADLRAKLMAGAEEYELRRVRLSAKMEEFEKKKEKYAKQNQQHPPPSELGNNQSQEQEGAKTHALSEAETAEEAAVNIITEVLDSVSASASASAPAPAETEAEVGSTGADKGIDDEDGADEVLLRAAAEQKAGFEAAAHAMYEEELRIRTDIITQAGALKSLQDDMVQSNNQFQAMQDQIGSVAASIKSLEAAISHDKGRKIELGAKVGSRKSLEDAREEGERYDKLLVALTAAIDAMSS